MTNTSKSKPASITYRAAFIGEVVLTKPEHAHLSDEALMIEALAECERASIDADGIEIGDWRGTVHGNFYDGLAKVFDFFTDKKIEGYEHNTASTLNLISAADAVCDVKLDAAQAGYLLAVIKDAADCATDNDSWHARKAVLHPSER